MLFIYSASQPNSQGIQPLTTGHGHNNTHMKKILFISLFALIGFGANAQYGRGAKFALAVGDTLASVDTVQKIITATAGYNAMGIQVNLNKLSGTLAGKAYLYTSLDALNYQLTDSASYTATTTSSYSTPTMTHTAIFTKTTVPGVSYRLWIVSTATTSTPVEVWYTLRKNIDQ